MSATITEQVKTHGSIALATHTITPDLEGLTDRQVFDILSKREPTARRASENIICVAGLNSFLAAANWSAVENQNTNMGSPFMPAFIAPIFGAVGDGGGGIIDIGSDGQPLPQATIYVQAPGIQPSGTIYMFDRASSTWVPISYTGTTGGASPTLTGCTGGAGYTLHYGADIDYTFSVVDTDTFLDDELARAAVLAASITNASAGVDGYIAFSFLLASPTPSVAVPVIEAGIFVQASSMADTGNLFDHAVVPILWEANQLMTLTATFSYGNV